MQLPLPPPDGKERHAEVGLFPGLTSVTDKASWTVNVRIKFYADTSNVSRAEGSTVTLPARGNVVSTVPWSAPRFPLPPGFVPLGIAVIPENERAWTMELPLKAAP